MTNKIDKIQMPDGQVLKLNGGGGLELCDISMALYVDETKGLRRYLNGQIVDINTNTQAFLNRLLEIKNTNPDYFATEENWQSEALLNIDGCVYKFVLNYSGETVISVRLPKYPDYVEINAGGTLPVVGNGMTLGITNGSGTAGFYHYQANTAYVNVETSRYGTPVGGSVSNNSGTLYGGLGVTTDPTKSGIQTTLKQTKLKMRYFIQIATGSETEANIVNTLENVNGFTLLESKYSDKPLYNESWLLSNGQYNPKGTYPTVYEGLQVEHNTEIEAGTTVTLPSGISYTKRGLSVKLSTETYTDYDFVLNTTDETFRLPIKNGMEGIFASGYKWSAKISKSLNITYTAETNGFIVYTGSGTGGGAGESRLYINDSIVAVDGHNADVDEGHFYVPVNKGDTYKITDNIGMQYYYFVPVGSNGSLYYYVGETVQNANLIDAGRIGEQLANKQDKCIHIIDTYVNGMSGYRIWSDGYCEQWGLTTVPESSGRIITFLKTFKDTNYWCRANLSATDITAAYYEAGVVKGSKTTTSMVVLSRNYGSTNIREYYWIAKGYLARGQY